MTKTNVTHSNKDGKRVHGKYLPLIVVPYKALENFPKALYGTTGGTYSA